MLIAEQVAHYGLPAAGIILLSMLKQHNTATPMDSSQVRVWQDLNILVAEIQRGTIVRLGEPNYALLSQATLTIQSFLDQSIKSRQEVHTNSQILFGQQDDLSVEDWFPQVNPEPWNLEIGFWENLAEHPFLLSADPAFQG